MAMHDFTHFLFSMHTFEIWQFLVYCSLLIIVWISLRNLCLKKLGKYFVIKDIVQGICAHLPTPIPPHLKVFSSNDVATLLFCSSLAESQIFLKVLVYDFNIINQAKISDFFPGATGSKAVCVSQICE